MAEADYFPTSQIDRDVRYTEEGNRSPFGGVWFDCHKVVLSDEIHLVRDSRLRTALALADAARSVEFDPPLDVRVTAYVRPTGIIQNRPKNYIDVQSDFPTDTNERLAQWLDENH